MLRSIRIVVTLAAVLLVARPFDCFANSMPDPKAMDCCLKGKCGPTAKADECCKNTAPEDKGLTTSKTTSHSPCLATQAAVGVSLVLSFADPVQQPPPAHFTCRNLPLLI